MGRRFWLKRLLRTLITLWAVVTFTFVVLRTSGDPVVALLSPDALPAEIEQFRQKWNLDRSLFEQYLAYMLNLFSGDFGHSYQDGRAVTAIIAERLPNTLQLGAMAYLWALAIGIPAGILAALKRDSLLDRGVMTFAVVGFALPNYFLGILLILLFSFHLRWLPSAGAGSALHLIMPGLTLGFYVAGTLARFTRSAMLEVLERPYMRTIRAKGAPFLYGVLRHALPNAAIPIVTILGLNLGALVGGTVVVEAVFGWPGIGRLLVQTVASRDLAVVQGLVLMMATFMVLANLLADLTYSLIDPRIRVSK
ncbi:ABC transporter permease [Nitratireductor aquibiodomus]|uniref:ABC transporter permease n=1 Tax=Nitratireductor aquibiodomus TaxID=204799 RepID=UPI001FEFF397|nr:ABC transporter permease [Nitratireductor aquibiodomus]